MPVFSVYPHIDEKTGVNFFSQKQKLKKSNIVGKNEENTRKVLTFLN